MRPQKLSKEQIQLHCMQTFKTHGYAGTSMDLLAKSGEFKHEVRQFEKSYDNQQAEQISLMV